MLCGAWPAIRRWLLEAPAGWVRQLPPPLAVAVIARASDRILPPSTPGTCTGTLSGRRVTCGLSMQGSAPRNGDRAKSRAGEVLPRRPLLPLTIYFQFPAGPMSKAPPHQWGYQAIGVVRLQVRHDTSPATATKTETLLNQRERPSGSHRRSLRIDRCMKIRQTYSK